MIGHLHGRLLGMLACLMLAVMAWGAGPRFPLDGAPHDTVLAALRSPKPDQRINACGAIITNIRERLEPEDWREAVPTLLRHLKYGDGKLRETAFLVLSFIDDPRVSPALVAALDDPALVSSIQKYPPTPEMVLTVLERDRGSEIWTENLHIDDHVLAWMHAALRDHAHPQRQGLVLAMIYADDTLMHLCDADLLEQIARTAPVREERLQAIELLQRIDDPRWPALLVTLSVDPDAQVRAAAISAFGIVDTPVLEAALLARLQDEDAVVRHAAAWKLGASTYTSPALRAAQQKLLDDPDVAMRQAVAGSDLARAMADPDPKVREHLPSILAGRLIDPDPAVRAEAVRLFGRLMREPNPVGDAAINAMQYWGYPAFLPTLMEIAREPEVSGRGTAIAQLGMSGDARAFEPLVAVATDPQSDRTICSIAVTALGELGDRRAIPVLQRLSKQSKATDEAAEALTNLQAALAPPPADPLVEVKSLLSDYVIEFYIVPETQRARWRTEAVQAHIYAVLRAGIKDDNGHVYAGALRLADQLWEPRTADVLLELARDPAQRSHDIYVMLRILAEHDDPRVIPLLRSALRHRHWEPLRTFEHADLLSWCDRFTDPGLLEELRGLLGRPDWRKERPTILAMLARRGDQAVLADLRKSGDLQAFGESGLPEFADAICAALRADIGYADSDDRATEAATAFFGHTTDPAAFAKVADALFAHLARQENIVLPDTLAPLVKRQDPRVIVPLDRLIRSQIPLVTIPAAELLGKLRHPDALASLAWLLNTGGIGERCTAAQALVGQGPAAIPALRAAARENTTLARVAAIEALAELGATEAIPDLQACLADPSTRVQDAVRAALERFDEKDVP